MDSFQLVPNEEILISVKANPDIKFSYSFNWKFPFYGTLITGGIALITFILNWLPFSLLTFGVFLVAILSVIKNFHNIRKEEKFSYIITNFRVVRKDAKNRYEAMSLDYIAHIRDMDIGSERKLQIVAKGPADEYHYSGYEMMYAYYPKKTPTMVLYMDIKDKRKVLELLIKIIPLTRHTYIADIYLPKNMN